MDGNGTGRIVLDKNRLTGGSALSTFLGGTRVNSTQLSFKDNEWMHVAAVGNYADKTVTFYVNGEQDGNPVSTNAFESCVGNYRIGGHKDGTRAYWSGMLDEMYFFKRALSKEEIVKVMNNQWEDPSAIKKNTSSSADIYVYPNPAKSILNVAGGKDIIFVSLYSLDGIQLLRESVSRSLNVRNLTPGTYLLKVESKGGRPVYKKVVIG
jgi:hypothetical protein